MAETGTLASACILLRGLDDIAAAGLSITTGQRVPSLSLVQQSSMPPNSPAGAYTLTSHAHTHSAGPGQLRNFAHPNDTGPGEARVAHSSSGGLCLPGSCIHCLEPGHHKLRELLELPAKTRQHRRLAGPPNHTKTVENKAPAVLPFTAWKYGKASRLVLSPDSPPIASRNGVRQGDASGSALFALALQQALQVTQAAHPS